jgi:hypothetical protein
MAGVEIDQETDNRLCVSCNILSFILSIFLEFRF